MSRNSAFGRRIQMVRRQLSMELPRLAELGPIASGRLELIELGQLDDTDLNPDELARLSNVLNCSVDYLVCGYDKVPGFQGYTVGNRARGDQFQEELHLEPKPRFGPDSCPICGGSVSGSRCDRGHFLE